MTNNIFNRENIDIAWCPGCGDFGILNALKMVLAELEIAPKNLVIVSGIGQAAKIPQYLNTNMFNGLHGRALPVATAIKAVNSELTVIAQSGDGDMYGEGGNHFIHAIRRNPDISNFVHNNMVYGLTKGQASPTSQRGFKTPVQVTGVSSEPFNPLAVAIALNASFVARVSIGDVQHTKEIMKQAILHKGYALVDMLQPCPSFNKVNNYRWYKEHVYKLEDSYESTDRVEAFKRSVENDPLPLGIFYRNTENKTFNENLSVYKQDSTILHRRKFDLKNLKDFIIRK